MTPKGLKLDDKKDRWDLIPWVSLRDVVKVLSFGACKYSPENWKRVEPYRERYFAALMRHITAWRSGELNDQETGAHHLAHAICCMLFIIWKDKRY